jgi:hypothetical protein
MTFKNRMSAMPFAQFLGLAMSAKAEEDDEDRKQKEDESDDDYAKRMEEKDKEEEAKRAEEEKKKEDARKAEEEKKKEEEAKRAKKAKRADDDGDDDADMEDDDGDDEEEGKRAGRAQGARQRERNRCARIVVAGIALGRVNQACAFAFDTKLSSNQAIAALNAASLDTVATRGSGLRERMSAVQVANPGTNAGASAVNTDPSKAAAASIIAAGERARNGK